jgi:type II secretory pathway pseudopilin PulG
MTLLEALVALVILGLSATGLLSLFQQVSVRAADSTAWTRVVAEADAAMEHAVLAPAGALADSGRVRGVFRSVEWRSAADGLREVVVTVRDTTPNGPSLTLHRLVAP